MTAVDNGRETVSKLLEGIYDDYCVAQMAKSLNKWKEYAFLMNRAGYYRNVYDAGSGFMRGKNKKGEFKKDVDVVSAARNVAIFDTIASLVAACVVVPAVFAFGLDVSSGPPLLFITLAQVFQQMPFGDIFAAILFVAVVFAAITSLMNLFEAPVEALQEQLGLSRTVSVLIIAVIAVGVGLFIEGGSTVSDWMDVISIYVIPVGAFLAAIMFFWVCPRGFAKGQAELGRKRPLGRWFDFFTRYVFVFVTALVIILGIFYGGIG